ncbi:hypothetical protein THIOKS13140004 [Thiocapsa sp. KS1]|nr:hypothetical protein THIOKS13140004 [Thiocapsa sp. KS1]
MAQAGPLRKDGRHAHGRRDGREPGAGTRRLRLVVSRVRRRAITERPPTLRGGREGGSEGWGRALGRSAADRAVGLARWWEGRAPEAELGCLSVRLGSDLHGSTGRDLLREGGRIEAVFPAGLIGTLPVLAEPAQYHASGRRVR